ncbi:MAG TPA: hypothetical protein VGI95_05075 [Caulobacteraceae bacterium]|jgi:hypothetical protein
MTTTAPTGSRGYTPDPIRNPLILDMLAWLAREPRPYAEVMEVWRTSCPRLTIWEDAVDGGLVVRRPGLPGPIVALTSLGERALRDAAVLATGGADV